MLPINSTTGLPGTAYPGSSALTNTIPESAVVWVSAVGTGTWEGCRPLLTISPCFAESEFEKRHPPKTQELWRRRAPRQPGSASASHRLAQHPLIAPG